MYLPIWLRMVRRRLFGLRPATILRQIGYTRQLTLPVRRRTGSVSCRVARSHVRLLLENLEDRLAPSVTAINVNDNADRLDNPAGVTAATLGSNVSLRDAINAANNSGAGSNNSYIINLQANTLYDLAEIDNYWYGPNALPGIFSNITIQGNGAIIQRDANASSFRLFYVSGGIDGPSAGDLTLDNVTLQGGMAEGGGSDLGGGGLGAGGAIFNQGSLSLNGVTLTNNQAVGGSATAAIQGYGGGGMGQDANLSNGGGFGGALNVPTGYFGSIGGNGSNGDPRGGGGGGGGFGTAQAGANGNLFAGGDGGGQGGFGGSGGGFTGGNYSGDGGGGGTGAGGAGGNGGGFGGGGVAFSGSTAGGGGGGVGGGGSSSGSPVLDADGGGGGFGGGGGIGLNGGNGGFGGGGGGFLNGVAGRGGFGGGNGGLYSNSFVSPGGGGAGMGGGIFSMFGSVSLTNCTLTANTVQGGSGYNGGSGYGGAIFNLDGNLNLTFCTLADNNVAGGTGAVNGGSSEGGALYNLAFGNNIFTGAAQSATATILDSILSDSSGGADLANNVVNGANINTATVTLSGPDLVMSTRGTINGTPSEVTDPQLGPLQDNGGPTPTMAITSSSPAYQTGIAVPGITTDQRGSIRHDPPSLGAYEPLTATTLAASNVTMPYSPNAQKVTLTANVSSPNGPVNEGTVKFTVLQGNIVIGKTTTSSAVKNGVASVQYALPAGMGINSYTIDAVYSGGPDFAGSVDESHTLTIAPANVTVAGQDASVTYNLSNQTVTLNASIANTSIPSDIVNSGAVTFTIKKGNAIIGSVQGAVSNNKASTVFTVPGALAAGNYTLAVHYSASPSNFTDSGDTNATFTVNSAQAATAAVSNSIGFRPGAQNVTLTANVSSTAGTVNEGVVTFTVMQGSTVIGTATSSNIVSSGEASVIYALPAATAAGTYTIAVSYSDSTSDFIDSGDTNSTLTIAPALANTTAVNATAYYSPNKQSVTLQANLANVAQPSDGVGEGVVTFTISSGKTIIGSVSNKVSNNTASAAFTVPAGLAAGNYTLAVHYGDALGNFADNSDTNAILALLPAQVTTTAVNTSTFYSPNAQALTFTANVADASIPTDTVNEGVVVFTVKSGNTVIGNGRGTVSGGTASANFDWSAGRAPPGNYTIAVSYLDTLGNFVDGGDNNGILAVTPANVTVTAANATVVLPKDQSVTLSVNIADASFATDTVNEGAVTFTILNDKTVIGTPVKGTVSGNTASANFTLPADLAAMNYTIAVGYTDSKGNYSDSGDSNAILTVLLVPTVTTNPDNQTVSVGQTATFTAAAGANPAATVQWQVSNDGGTTWTNITGATSTTLTLSNVPFSLNGNEYQAVFTNNLGTTTTNAAILTVLASPVVTTDPSNQTVTAGQTATFTAAASGNPLPTVQWQVSSDGGTTWTDISGATSTTLNISSVQASQNGYQYRAVFSNSGGTARSNAAVLTVQIAPVVTINPIDQSVLAGQTVLFQATASGNPLPTVQWQVSSDGGKTFTNISGATSPTLTLGNVPSALNGNEYQAVFTNSLGTVTTAAATLTVQAPPSITSSNNTGITAGQSVNFTVTATGTPTPTFTVFGNLPPGVTFTDNGDGTATLGGMAATGTQGTYHFTIAAHNGIGSDFTQSFTLRVSAASVPPPPPPPPPATISSSQPPTLNVPPLLALLGGFVAQIETINGNGTESVAYNMLGTVLIEAVYDSSGNFVSASLFGLSVPNWVWYL